MSTGDPASGSLLDTAHIHSPCLQEGTPDSEQDLSKKVHCPGPLALLKVMCLTLVSEMGVGMPWAMPRKGPHYFSFLCLPSVRVSVLMAGTLAAPCGRGILRMAPVQPPHKPRALMGGETLTHLIRALALPKQQGL